MSRNETRAIARDRTRAVASAGAALALALGAALAIAFAGAGCTGVIGERGAPPGGGPGGSSGGPGSGGGIGTTDNTAALCAAQGPGLHAGRTRVRRLTRSQYDHTVRDLLATADTNPSAAIAPDERIGPFYSNGIAPITDLIVQQHQEAAGKLALAAVPRMAQIAGCNLAADTADTCAKQFIADFGMRAYRRPLEADEAAKYLTLYGLGKSNADAANGFRVVVEAMLQSPFFLYHADVGASGVPSTATVALTSFELASRLSYFLWDTMPDATLFAAARDGSLPREETLRAQVTRMLNDPRAGEAIPYFHMQWLGINDMEEVIKDPALFPSYTPALAAAMRAETAAFTDYVVRRGDGLVSTLFTADFTFPSAPLFSLYGMNQPAGFAAGDRVTLDPTQRAGLLTQAAFLATHAHRDQTSPVHRGIIVRENMLCTPIPSPPPEVNAAPLPPVAGKTTRERFSVHESDQMCASCHVYMDPIGLAFENYDAIGAWRTTENGQTIDATGEIKNSPLLAGTFTGAVGLARKLAASTEVANCVANQWFRFALGRMEANDDACTLKAVHDAFKASGGNVRELLTNLVLSDAFRNVRAVGTAADQAGK